MKQKRIKDIFTIRKDRPKSLESTVIHMVTKIVWLHILMQPDGLLYINIKKGGNYANEKY